MNGAKRVQNFRKGKGRGNRLRIRLENSFSSAITRQMDNKYCKSDVLLLLPRVTVFPIFTVYLLKVLVLCVTFVRSWVCMQITKRGKLR
jgi:hypothetical protein